MGGKKKNGGGKKVAQAAAPPGPAEPVPLVEPESEGEAYVASGLPEDPEMMHEPYMGECAG